MRREKQKAKWWVIYVNQQSLKQNETGGGGGEAWLYLVLWLAVGLFEVASAIFEVNALTIKSLSQALALQLKRKKKNNC